MMDIRLKVGLFGALKLGLAMLKLSVAILTNAMLTVALHMLTLVLRINRALEPKKD